MALSKRAKHNRAAGFIFVLLSKKDEKTAHQQNTPTVFRRQSRCGRWLLGDLPRIKMGCLL
jgi:hypothetical protein